MKNKNNNPTLLTGPLNIVRLEGEIFGIKKVLYVFFDIHMPCDLETRCDDIFADTITTYMIEQFRNAGDKTIDFFLETFPIGVSSKSEMRDIYLRELRQLFAQAFRYNEKENKVLQSKLFPKVRLHYIDIRDYLFWDILIDQSGYLYDYFKNIYDAVVVQNNLPHLNSLLVFKNGLLKFVDDVDMIYNLFIKRRKSQTNKSTRKQSKGTRKSSKGTRKSSKDTKKSRRNTRQSSRVIRMNYEQVSEKEKEENILNLISKIREKYAHQEVKDMIDKIINEYLKEALEFILNGTDTVIKLVDSLLKLTNIDPMSLNTSESFEIGTNRPEFTKLASYGDINIKEITKIVMNILSIMSDIGAVSSMSTSTILDTYFLRRFLDKDYVVNGVSYTGAAHSQMYVYILVKYFDFKITHASYLKYSINETNKKIKGSELDFDFRSWFMPEILQQCSNITGFPKGFS